MTTDSRSPVGFSVRSVRCWTSRELETSRVEASDYSMSNMDDDSWSSTENPGGGTLSRYRGLTSPLERQPNPPPPSREMGQPAGGKSRRPAPCKKVAQPPASAGGVDAAPSTQATM